MTLADPRPAKRIVDPEAYAEFRRDDHECLCCGGRHVEAHHLLSRSRRGDDVVANLVPLCLGCHRAYHGTPYRGAFGARFTPEIVRSAIGRFPGHESGDDARAYLIQKLGRGPAEAYMRREFGVDL